MTKWIDDLVSHMPTDLTDFPMAEFRSELREYEGLPMNASVAYLVAWAWRTAQEKSKPRFVEMRSERELIRDRAIEYIDCSDDGEFVRYKVLPNGPTVGEWARFGKKLMVVDCDVIHVNQLLMAPQLYLEPPP